MTASTGRTSRSAGLGHDGLGGVNRGGFDQAVLHGIALGSQEGIGHAAADDQLVALGQQILNDRDLVADLGAAQDGNVGMLRIGGGATQVLQLLFHQETGDGRQEARHALGGGVSAVRRAEGIVDVHLAQSCQRLRQLQIVLLLAGVEAGVLQHQHVARLEGRGHSSTSGPTQSGAICTGLAQKGGQSLGGGLEAEFRRWAALGATEVAHQDQ